MLPLLLPPRLLLFLQLQWLPALQQLLQLLLLLWCWHQLGQQLERQQRGHQQQLRVCQRVLRQLAQQQHLVWLLLLQLGQQ
jgi:hypothetical protein